MIAIIAAMTKDRVIGKNGKLPWNIHEEFNSFLKTIKDSTAIMGRRTYESIKGKPHAENNIVVSSTLKQAKYAEVCKTFKEAINKARSYNKPIFILGGTNIYKEALPIADKMYISYIKKDYKGDTYFPEFDENYWEIEDKKNFKEFELVVYKRKKE